MLAYQEGRIVSFQTTNYRVEVLTDKGWANCVPEPRSRRDGLAMLDALVASNLMEPVQEARLVREVHQWERVKHITFPPRPGS